MPAEPPPRREATPAEVRALSHPIRLRIIRLLYDRSLTNRELARALGENPATVLHHVRTLLATGFIEPDAERRGARGNVEKPYRSTGRSWSVEIEDEHAASDVSWAALTAFLAEVHEAQPNADLLTSRLALNLTPGDRRELDRRISALLGEYAARPTDADGEPWSIFVATHRRAIPDLPALPDRTDGQTRPDRARRPISTGIGVEIGEARSDDPAALLLVRAQWSELSARYGAAEPEPSSIRKPTEFAPPTGAFFLLRVDGDAVRCAGICRYDDTSAEINAVYVAPLQRGHGYGRLLIHALEARAIELGYSTVRLETGDAQPEAIGMYHALGYQPIDRFGDYTDLPRSLCFERVLDA